MFFWSTNTRKGKRLWPSVLQREKVEWEPRPTCGSWFGRIQVLGKGKREGEAGGAATILRFSDTK